MTEIPEHLLKRAAERRAAMGKGGDAPADAPAADAGAAPAAAAPAPAAVEKKAAAPAPLPTLGDVDPRVVPDIPVVAAAKARKRVPFWAASVLALLPLWGIIYVASVQEPPAGDSDPLAIGSEAYTTYGCSGCHGGTGGGGTGPQLSGGEISLTFADPLSQVYWIRHASLDGARPDGTYGDLDRPGGPRNTGDLTGQMSAFPDIPAEEMAALVIYIREGLSGADPADDPNFNSELFESDLASLEAMIEAVDALPLNDPDAVAGVEGAETE